MRIAFDVSRSRIPRSGIGTYLRGSLAGSSEAAAGEHEIVAFAPTSPQGRRRSRPRSPGIPVELSLQFLPSRTSGARAGAASARPAVERFLGPIDVLHFSDWMYPPQRGGIRATTIHDLVPLRHPGVGAGPDAEHAHGEVPERRAHLRPRLRELGVHGARRRRAARRARGPRAGRAAGGGRRLHERRRAGRARRRLRPHRGDARAAQEPRALVEAHALLGRDDLAARGRRRARVGRAAGARPAGHRQARLRRRRRAGAPLPRRRGRSPTRRGSRASGCR